MEDIIRKKSDSSATEPLEDFTLSVIVPVFNEINTIEIVLKEIIAVPVRKEILVIDDGSTDGTREFIEKYQHADIRKFYHKQNRGKGAAVRTGLDHFKGDLVIIQDADLEYPPDQHIHLIEPIIAGKADVVYGTRFIGVHRVFMFWHYFANRFLTLVTNVLYNTMLTDMETCYKVFHRRAIEGLKLRSNRFNIEPEITAKLFKNKKFRIVEMPITYYGRTYEEGKKIGWKDGFEAIWALIKYRFVD